MDNNHNNSFMNNNHQHIDYGIHDEIDYGIHGTSWYHDFEKKTILDNSQQYGINMLNHGFIMTFFSRDFHTAFLQQSFLFRVTPLKMSISDVPLSASVVCQSMRGP